MKRKKKSNVRKKRLETYIIKIYNIKYDWRRQLRLSCQSIAHSIRNRRRNKENLIQT